MDLLSGLDKSRFQTSSKTQNGKTSRRASKGLAVLPNWYTTSSSAAVAPSSGLGENALAKKRTRLRRTRSEIMHLTDAKIKSVSGSIITLDEAFICDECVDDENAVAACADCKLRLCAGHAKVHPKSRSSYNHKVEPLRGGTGQSFGADDWCSNHSGKQLLYDCHVCKESLCEDCLKEHTEEHKTSIVHKANRSKDAKTAFRASMAGKSADSIQRNLCAAVDAVNDVIKAIQRQTKMVTSRINAYFSDVMHAIGRRERHLLSDLDQLRSQKLGPLEEQRKRLQSALAALSTISSPNNTQSLDRGMELDHSPLARLDAAKRKEIEDCMENLEPCVVAKFAFTSVNDTDLSSAVKKIGQVADTTLDADNSTLECPTSVALNSEMTIAVAVKDGTGRVATKRQAVEARVTIRIMTPGNHTIIKGLTEPTEANATSLVAHYRPSVIGYHTISVLMRGRHIRGSPVSMLVRELPTFDPTKCHPTIDLSNNNKTAELCHRHGDACVLGTKTYVKGEHDAYVRLQNNSALPGNFVIGVTSHSDPPLNDHTHSPGLSAWFGWCTTFVSRTGQSVTGADVGQPWKAGDVIHVHLDCDQHCVTVRHQRSDKEHTIHDVTGNLRLFVNMCRQGQRVTLEEDEK